MTPVVSNGPNYLTYLSASILEATHLGKMQVFSFLANISDFLDRGIG